MKICIVVDNLNQKTGWGRLALKLEENLTQRGFQVGFVTQLAYTHKNNVLIVPLRNFSWKSSVELINTILKIRKFTENYDTVLCFDANPYGVIVALSLLGKKVRFVLYAIGSYSLLTSSLLRNLLIRFAYARASQVLIVSEFVKKQIEKSGLYFKHSIIVPVGVDPKVFYPAKMPLKNIKGKYIIGVGALKHRKGFHLSLEAFALIALEFAYLQYLIVGHREEDSYSKSLDARIKELKLESRVRFISNISDDELRSLYTFAEFFLLTPITESNAIEGFGMVYLEAARCGITSIGTIETGAQEAIINGETGILTDSTPESIADAIRLLMTNQEYRLTLSQRAKARTENFEWNVVTDQLLEALV